MHKEKRNILTMYLSLSSCMVATDMESKWRMPPWVVKNQYFNL